MLSRMIWDEILMRTTSFGVFWKFVLLERLREPKATHGSTCL